MNNRDIYLPILANNIKRLRLAQGISQAQLAKASGISPKTISNLEKGTIGKRFSTHQLFDLCTCLDCTVSSLFTDI